MPITPTYPGVYIEEVPSAVRTITGVSTSIAAFFGRTVKGPMNKAVRILNNSDFIRNFGEPHPKSELGYSVRHFFSNGGTDCYVVRLAHGGRKASLNLKDIFNRNVLVVRAKTEGIWGDGIRLEVDYNTINPDETFNLTIIQEDGSREVTRESHNALRMNPYSQRFAPKFVSAGSNLVDVELHEDAKAGGASDIFNFETNDSFAGFSQSRIFRTTPISDFRDEFESIIINTPKFEINVDDTGYFPVDLSDVFGSAAPAIILGSTWPLDSMKDRITDVINQQLNTISPGIKVTCSWITHSRSGTNYAALRITSDSGGPSDSDVASNQRTALRIRRGVEKDFAVPMMMGIEQGGVEVTRNSGFRPVPNVSFFKSVDDLVELGSLHRDDILFITIDSGDPIPLDFSHMTAAEWFIDLNSNNDGIREKLRAIAQAVNENNKDWKAELWGYHLTFRPKNGSINKTASGVISSSNSFLGDTQFANNVRQYTLGLTGTSNYQIPGTPGINNGDDGGAPELEDFDGNEDKKTGFYALDNIDLFNLMVIPGDEDIKTDTHKSLWLPASVYCANRRAFLLMDAPKDWTKDGLPAVKNNTSAIDELRIGVVKENSAVFYPRLKYYRNGMIETIGASGAIAGLMARIDASRGVWKASAGIEADLRSIIGVDVKLTDMENGILNQKGVNCLRIFPSGVINWGARTLFGDDNFSSEWKYIPVRRTALYIEESLYRGLKWVVFEPNDEPLWSQIRLNVGAFMNGLFRKGAFQGRTSREAYFVKCDSETTTQNDIDLGIVNIEVGFAPLKPAEFVIIKIQQIAGQLQT